jgi:nucleotide-binding universal stress UspA family protein
MYKILLASDGSTNSFKAAEEVAKLAGSLNAEVTVISVVHEMPFFGGHEGLISRQAPTLQSSMNEIMEKTTKEVLQKTEAFLKEKGVKVVTKLGKGNPAEIIMETAAEGNFNLIVMGSRGLGGMKEMLLGSISNKVAHLAKTSVLIIK